MESDRGDTNRLHILVVDDDVRCLASVEDLLREDGHLIATATRGSEAVALAREWRVDARPIDLSILDYHVPDLSGLETYLQLSAELPRMGAIFISGDVSHGLEERLLSAGGFAFVPKPLHPSHLRETVRAFQGEWSIRFQRGV